LAKLIRPSPSIASTGSVELGALAIVRKPTAQASDDVVAAVIAAAAARRVLVSPAAHPVAAAPNAAGITRVG